MTQAVKTYNANMRHDFTLVELMIVLAIIAVIASIAIPQLMEDREEQPAAPATPPAPAWSQGRVLEGDVRTTVVTSPDGQQWVVFAWSSGTAALPYTPRVVPAKPVGPE